jgi:hypothetical protein
VTLEALQKGSGPIKILKREPSILELPVHMDRPAFEERRTEDGSWIPINVRIPFHSDDPKKYTDVVKCYFEEKFREWSVQRTWKKRDFFKIEPENLRERSLFVWRTRMPCSERIRNQLRGPLKVAPTDPSAVRCSIKFRHVREDRIRLAGQLKVTREKERVMVPDGGQVFRKPISINWVRSTSRHVPAN